jgi:diguanylate cyclase (GGDEF)-like protein
VPLHRTRRRGGSPAPKSRPSAVADAIAGRVRGNDFVARVGGEEFLIGCVGNDTALALTLAERVRAGVAAARMPGVVGQAGLSCTVSVGISGSFHSPEGRDQATREADLALYAAKSGGRNRVVVFEPESA